MIRNSRWRFRILRPGGVRASTGRTNEGCGSFPSAGPGLRMMAGKVACEEHSSRRTKTFRTFATLLVPNLRQHLVQSRHLCRLAPRTSVAALPSSRIAPGLRTSCSAEVPKPRSVQGVLGDAGSDEPNTYQVLALGHQVCEYCATQAMRWVSVGCGCHTRWRRRSLRAFRCSQRDDRAIFSLAASSLRLSPRINLLKGNTPTGKRIN
jgi:hypothetical protein